MKRILGGIALLAVLTLAGCAAETPAATAPPKPSAEEVTPTPTPTPVATRPLLAMIFSVVGIWGGSWVAVDWLGVYDGSYWANMQNSVTFSGDVINGIIKSIVFAFVVTWIAVFQGYDCEPTSEGISRATTKTVVYASLAVLGLDFILTALMFGDF